MDTHTSLMTTLVSHRILEADLVLPQRKKKRGYAAVNFPRDAVIGFGGLSKVVTKSK